MQLGDDTIKPLPSPADSPVSLSRAASRTRLEMEFDQVPENAALAFSNGSFPEWTLQSAVIVVCCSMIWFCFLGVIYIWGLFSDQLLQKGVASASALSLIGSLGPGLEVALAIPSSALSVKLGVAKTAALGGLCCGLGPLLASFCTESFPGLLVTHGIIFGTGCSLCFNTTATLPTQYFLKKRGMATGIVYSVGALGSAILSIAVSQTIAKYGIVWAFRLIGILTLVMCLPASYFLKARFVGKEAGRIDLRLFQDLNFNLLFLSGVLAALPIFTVPYLLPTFARTLGVDSTTSAWLLVAYSLASTAGRLLCGVLADNLFGPLNTVILTQWLMVVSLLVVWNVTSTLGTLILMVVLNGFSSGGYFAQIGPVVSQLFKQYPTQMVMSLAITGWIIGNISGSPISGALLDASSTSHDDFVRSDYLGLILLSGTLAVTSTALLMVLRYRKEHKLFRRL